MVEAWNFSVGFWSARSLYLDIHCGHFYFEDNWLISLFQLSLQGRITMQREPRIKIILYYYWFEILKKFLGCSIFPLFFWKSKLSPLRDCPRILSKPCTMHNQEPTNLRLKIIVKISYSLYRDGTNIVHILALQKSCVF